jgi:hypothetical protein
MPKRTMNDAFPSKYLTAADVHGKSMEVVIESVDYAKMRDGAEKPIAMFEGLSKGVVLNKTKAKFLSDLTGSPNFDDWVGAQVTLSAGTVNFAGETVDCINFARTKAAKKVQVEETLNDEIPSF